MDARLSLFYSAAHIPVSRFHGNDIIENIHGGPQDYNIPLVLFAGIPVPLPPFWYAHLTEHAIFGGFRLPDGDQILLEPVPVHELTMTHMLSILREAGRKAEDLNALILYFSHQAVADESMLTASLRMLSQLMGQTLNADPERAAYRRSSVFPPLPEPDTGEDDADPVMENALLGAIRHGRPDDLKNLFSRYQISASQRARSEMPVLLKSYTYGSITLAAREAVRGGVDYPRAMRLCTAYIDRLISTPYAREQTAVFMEALTSFAEEVHRVRSLLPENAGNLALRVSGYVESHLYEPLSPTAAAASLGYTVSYLCAAFRRQTGMTVAEYINRMKIEEAKRLLDMRSDSIGNISSRLGYSSQSYFCTVFRQVTGMTPGQYLSG